MKALYALFAALALCVPALAEEEKQTMQIVIGDRHYEIRLERNETAQAIAAALPLSFEMKRFGGHEFYATLPFRPPFAAERTSQIKAGCVYYWDGWNAFVINYIDWDISPYKVVRVGEIADKSICTALDAASDSIAADTRQTK